MGGSPQSGLGAHHRTKATSAWDWTSSDRGRRPWGHRLKEARRAVQVRAIKDVVEN